MLPDHARLAHRKNGEDVYTSLFKKGGAARRSFKGVVTQNEPNEDNPLYGINVAFTVKMRGIRKNQLNGLSARVISEDAFLEVLLS